MAGKSTYLETKLLSWIKGTAFPSAPASVYVALFNGDPTDAGTGGTEVTTTIRAAGRVAATFGAISNRTISNSAIVDFGNAAGATTVTHFGLFDAASAGNMLYSAPLTGGSQSINQSNPVSFAIAALSIAED